MTTTTQLFELSPDEEALFLMLLELWGSYPTDVNSIRIVIANYSRLMTLGEKWDKAFTEEDNNDSTTGS